jgi:hypothetical protein
MVDLYNRKLTYGEFNQRRQALFDEVRNRAADIWQRAQAQQQAQQQAQEAQLQAQQQAQQAERAQEEAYRRQAALYLLNQMRANQPAPVPYQIQMPQRPSTVTTNCMWIGTLWRCTTQ